jgi:3-hydroxymyristoyl/3-hydroxydecanoyl-(acyl carrier protein) dehydratase
MPGVLQIEAMAQVGAILLMDMPENRDKIPYLMSLDKVKFRRPVYPGDQLRLEIQVLRLRSRMSACLARALVEGELCSEAEIRSVMMDRAMDGR